MFSEIGFLFGRIKTVINFAQNRANSEQNKHDFLTVKTTWVYLPQR